MKHLFELIEDFIRAYFDKLLLTAILMMLIGIAAQAPEPIAQWAMGQANTVIGAIVMLMTGQVINRKLNGKSSPPPTQEVESNETKTQG